MQNDNNKINRIKIVDHYGDRMPEFGVYYVKSQSGEEDYKVDLTQRLTEDGRAHGVCECTWFSCVANPNLEKYGRRVPYAVVTGIVRQSATECKHIAAANAKYHSDVTMKMFAKMTQGVAVESR